MSKTDESLELDDLSASAPSVGVRKARSPLAASLANRSESATLAEEFDGAVGRPETETIQPMVFGFEMDLETSDSVPVFGDFAVIRARFRHFHSSPLRFEPGVDGAFNLGIRLYRVGGHNQLFEDRMVLGDRPIEPNVWTSASVAVPTGLINFIDQFVLVADIVKEKEYWFAVSGLPEFRGDVKFTDGREMDLSQAETPVITPLTRANPPSMPSKKALSESPKAEVKPAATVNLVFDVSDLIQYFRDARLPTGIQRVQIEVITNLIFSIPEDCSLKIACFTKQTDTWVEVPLLFFNHICKLAVVNGDPSAADWLRVLEELRMHLQQGRSLVFAKGAYLINLGTSWWLQNYFLHVRAAKARYGIRYVPYVHDCIPIMTPEHCVETLTRDFITWALGAFQHADHIMVNSKATAVDVKAVAAKLGHAIDEPIVVSLDADYRAANALLPPEMGAHANSEIFQKNDIRAGQYVLFVSTIESRKNHLMAFSAWLSLTKKHGIKQMPKLVCVGNRGWLNDAIYSKLSASKVLRQKVVMLAKISDPDLELLYRNCLFTLYPSSYEGWGLPVTESLCFGKVPVLANGSSLPEAGGEFGEYFDLGSESALREILEKMIFDSDYRSQKERKIESGFRPRLWAEIAADVLGAVRKWNSKESKEVVPQERFASRGLWPFPAKLGRYYGLTENDHTHIWPGMVAGEMFRQGDGWWWTEPWGCWTKPKGARLAFVAPLKTDQSAIVYVGVRGVQGERCTATVSLEGVSRRELRLDAEQLKWLVFRVSKESLSSAPYGPEGLLLEFTFSSDKFADFQASTGGSDHRLAAIGVTGFMVCASDDIESRMNFVESVTLSDMHHLMGMSDAELQ